MEQQEQPVFSNMDSWRGGGNNFGLTFKQIIILHINRCVQNGSQEMHGGYWNTRGNNPVTKTYVPNSRDVFNNSVKMLKAILLCHFDKKIEGNEKKLNEEFEEEHKAYKKKDNSKMQVLKDWYDYKVNWHTKLFEELIQLSRRLNFFEEETAEEEG